MGVILRQLAAQVPARLGQLGFLHGDPVAAIQLTDEAHQERVREHPRLGFVKAEVFDPEASLLHDLAVHRVLNRLTDLIKARDEGIFFERPTAIAREQQPVAVVHRDDHSRADLRVDRVFAMRADHGALDRAFLHARAASAAEFLGIIPAVQAFARSGGEQRQTRPVRHGAERRRGSIAERVCLAGVGGDEIICRFVNGKGVLRLAAVRDLAHPGQRERFTA